MPNAQVHVEYVSEVQTETDTQQTYHAASDRPLQLIRRHEFISLLRQRRGHAFTQEDEQFWDVIFGNYHHEGYSNVHRKDNPHVRYLTADSCEKLLKHREQFCSGVDFQHLPSGFLLIKNPQGGGVRDVLHYNEHYAQFQPKDDNDVLAITLMTQDELKATPTEHASFNGAQAEVYAALLAMRTSASGNVHCTESQLKDAFIRFSTIIHNMGLRYEDLALHGDTFQEKGNPVVLIGRWKTVMSNPHLKKADIHQQWKILTQLPLTKSHEAIRAITDYAYDQRPCGFIRPEMDLSETGFGNSYTGEIRPNDDVKTMPRGNIIASFWRYIAYQPKRNSMDFYEKALKRLNQITMDTETRRQMLQMLASSTTRKNHTAECEQDEATELTAWDTLCHVVEVGPLGIRSLQYTDGVVSRLHALSEHPNVAFLESIAKHIKKRIIYGQELVILSNKLGLLVTNLGNSLYHGSRFYFLNRRWQTLSIKDYVELQYEFYRLTGGEHAIRDIYDVVNTRDHTLPLQFELLAPHLSTFNLRSIQDIQHALSVWSTAWSQAHFARLTFCFELFHDLQTNDGLTPQTLAELIQYITSVEIHHDENWRLVLLAHLRTQFAPHFAEHYFDKKEKELRDTIFGLNPEQIAKVKACNFPESACNAIISLESAIVQQNPPQVDLYLTQLNERFVTLKNIVTPEDFCLFTEQLDEIRDLAATDYTTLPTLLDHIIAKRTLEGFDQIFVRNDIEKSTQSLLQKFAVFIHNIKPLVHDIQELKLDSLKLQEALATLVLNSVSADISTGDDYQRHLKHLVTQLNQAATAHPHIRHYLLDGLNHIPNKNSQAYMQHVRTFGETIQHLHMMLPSGEDASSKEHMFVIYSLLAHYHQHPTALTALIAQVQQLPTEHRAFMLIFLSRLMDSQQPIAGIETLIQQIASDDQKRHLFLTMCKKPPYPSVNALSAWLNAGTFETEYAAFSLKPYGERRLDYTFKYTHYQRQRRQFVGVDDIFTDAVGLELEQQLNHNRTKSVLTLEAELQTIRQKLPLNQADKLALVCLTVEMMARTASQLNHDKPPRQISQEFNTTQIMALYAKIVNPNNRLISQIDTGEGKSRIMMALAACQAAQGKTVDFLTSDMQLAERDYLTYKQFFTALNIPTSLISLDTPSQLYQKGGVNFTDNSQLLLLRNRSDIEDRPFAYLDERQDKRCLLLDEVDTFIHDKSKDAYNYVAQSKRLAVYVWIYPNIVNFVASLSLAPGEDFDPDLHVDPFLSYIDQHVLNREHKANLAQLVAHDPTQIKTWLRSAHTALHMEADKHYIMTPPDKDKLYLVRDHSGHARYSRKIFVPDHGRPVEGSSFADGVHQCLCAKENIALKKHHNTKRDAFIIPPENETQRASFPATFIAHYDEGSVYGVSGTTRSAAPLSNPDVINHEKYTYLIMPREKTLIREDKHVWLAKDEVQQIAFIKRAIIKHLKSNGSILLICKDDQQSLRLHNALQNDSHFMQTVQNLQLQRVHGLTSKHDEINAIRQAGLPHFITTSTAGMIGRGVDISADNLLVLSAYVPTEEDEIQIKGRTARFGKSGEYRMIPNKDDPDYPLNGQTYNVHNEVHKSQKERQRTAAFQKDISTLYAFFLEDVTKQFLDDCKRCPNEDRLEQLKKWQVFLGKMQKDWEPHRQKLLDAVQKQDRAAFSKTFNAFTEKWLPDVPVKLVKTDTEKQAKNVAKIYTSMMAQQRFFTPKRQAIHVQRDYDPSDDGQARIYSTAFAKTRATLRGERRWFADYHAWREGRGSLFPDLMATLHGERPLFATLYAIITRWIAECREWLNTKAPHIAGQTDATPQHPLEGDLDGSSMPLP